MTQHEERLKKLEQAKADRPAKVADAERKIKALLNAPADENYTSLCEAYKRQITRNLDALHLVELETIYNYIVSCGI